jgi:hypothetical protein
MQKFYVPILFLLISSCTHSLELHYARGHRNVAGPPVTRSQVVLTADTYARVHWNMATINVQGIGCANRFRSRYPTGPRVGMGYKFGGWDTVSTFLSNLAKGYGTGTGVETYRTVPFDCLTGISCTGLVSRAWRLNHKYTLIYPNPPDVPRQFDEITRLVEDTGFLFQHTANLRKGDAFLNRSHMMLFLYENRDGRPMILHATVEGVRFEEKSWFELWINGYIPIRYNHIRDEQNPAGTIHHPIVIDSDDFPYDQQGNTRNVVSMEFDRYAVLPDVNHQGPEAIYQLNLNSSATLDIQITDFKDEGIDNDILLLSSLDKDPAFNALDCLAGDDRQIVTTLNAGTYYIIVDSKNDLPGEYQLRVRPIGD